MNPTSRYKSLFILVTTMVSIMGGYLIFHATTWGPWAFSDSSAYLSAARNIVAGRGAIIINSNATITSVTEFPPLFPYILSLLTPIGGNFIITTRWLNIILFSISVFTLGLISFVAFDNLIISLTYSIIFAVSPLMVDTYSGFMSEPLFITLLIILVLLICEFLKSHNPIFLIPISIISLFLPLIRYAGIPFVICVGICIFLFLKNNSQTNLRIALVYILVSLIPISLWFLYQYNNLEKVGGKRFEINFSLIKSVLQSVTQEFTVVGTWIPYSGIYSSEITNHIIVFFFTSLFVVSIVAGLLATIKNSNGKNSHSKYPFQISLIFLIAYVFFIGFTHSITIPKIDIIDRIMSPCYPFLVLIILFSFTLFPDGRKSLLLKSGLLLIAFVTIRFYGISTFKEVELLHADGKGYTSRQYQQSEFIKKLAVFPANQHMISNSAAFVLFYTNRFPFQVDQFHNRSYGTGNAYGEQSFREKKAALIILYPEFRNYYGEKSGQLLQSLTTGLELDYQDEIGGIYYYPD